MLQNILFKQKKKNTFRKNNKNNKIDPVEVYCRIRPLSSDFENDKCLKVIDDNNLMLQVPEVL